MPDSYTIAFLVVPVVLAALGCGYALLVDRAESRRGSRRNDVDLTPRAVGRRCRSVSAVG